MKMIAGAALRAWRNSRRMRAAPRPANISTNEEADCAKKRAFDSLATALASSVLPVPGGPCSRMPFGTFAPSLRKRLGSRMNSTTSRSSSFASSTPSTSCQLMDSDDEGEISCGFVRGMYLIIQTTARAIAPMKMIGSQVSIQLCMSSHIELPPPPAMEAVSAWIRIPSVPSARVIVLDGASTFQPSGSAAPGSLSAARTASFASSQVICDVSSTVSL